MFEEPDVHSLPRGTEAVRCTCGGYAERVDSTLEECRANGCGRDQPGRECCAASFECVVCHKRYAGSYEAPEME